MKILPKHVKFLTTLIMLSFIIFFTSCSQLRAKREYNSYKDNCSILFSNKETTEIKKSSTGCIELSENRTTPYRLYFNISDENILKNIDSQYFYLSSPRISGAGGQAIWKFEALNIGETEIKYVSDREPPDWDEVSDYISYKVIVTD